MLRKLRRARSKKGMRYFLIALTVVLSVGLVGSFALMSMPSFQPEIGDNLQGTNEGYYERLEKDIEEYKEILEESPEELEILEKLGNAQYDLGIGKLMEGDNVDRALDNIKEALDSYEKALSIDPDNLELTIQTAVTAFYAGEKDRAETNYSKALKLDPESVEAKLSYGQFLLYGESDIAGAKKQWKEALALAADDATKETLEAYIQQADQMEKLQTEEDD
ncbi:MAG: hypothetical protein GX318_06300 [Clostridia bacterium]|nr:hypothetical protein [Clostridia bacterium]